MNLMYRILCLVLTFGVGIVSAGEWRRNTFPGQGFVDNGYAEGRGWDHAQVANDLSISPLDPDFMVFIDNVNAVLMTENGRYFQPLSMPFVNHQDCEPRSVEFSIYDKDTFYFIITPDYWNTVDYASWPAGLWRTADRGASWEHIYKLSEGQYERIGNNTARSLVLEDPCNVRSNHLFFGTTSHGIVRSTDGGESWSALVPELNNRRIKTMSAGTFGENQTVLYAVVEKRMPIHENGQPVPQDNWAPADWTECWSFEETLSGENGYDLSGSVADYTASCAEKRYAAEFSGQVLNIQNLDYTNTQSKVTVSGWVKTTNDNDQVIASFGEGDYWELGTSGGQVEWTVFGSNGTTNRLLSSVRIDDGDWHYVATVWDGGEMDIFIDGDEAGFMDAVVYNFGSGQAHAGTVGPFVGALDDFRIYNSRAFHLSNARGVYLYDDKHPVVQGALWRIIIDDAGNVSSAVRLHNGFDDFCELEINPDDPSQGWVTRKGIVNSWPWGARELYRFSDFGETLVLNLDESDLGDSWSYLHVRVNPSDANHVVLWCGGPYTGGFRYSEDGGVTWQAEDRSVVNGHIPSLQTWMPREYDLYPDGFSGDAQNVNAGRTIDFVPGTTNELFWFNPTRGGLMKSSDRGATFCSFASGGPNKETGQLAVAPSNPDHIAVGTLENGHVTTRNGGLTWTGHWDGNDPVLATLTAAAEAAGLHWGAARVAYGMAYNPEDAAQMIASFTGLGFIIRSEDGGLTWTDTGFQQPEDAPVLVFWSRTDTNTVYCGRMKSSDGGHTWSPMDKYVMAVSPTDGDLLVGIDRYVSDVSEASLLLNLSTDGGVSWSSLPDPPKENVPGTSLYWHVTATRKYPTRHPANLIAIDPASAAGNPRILLAGRSGVYEYTAADGWSVNSTGLNASPHYSLIDPVPWMGFVTFDPRPGYEHVVYAAATTGRHALDRWGGESNPNHGYPGGQEEDPFYVSRDSGHTWHSLHTAEFSDAPEGVSVKDMTVDDAGRLLAITAHGLYSLTGADKSPVENGVHFSSDEGFSAGSLDGQQGWIELVPGTFLVDPTGSGVVVLDSESSGVWKTASLSDQFFSTNYTQQVDFCFERGVVAPVAHRRMIIMSLDGIGGSARVMFGQRGNAMQLTNQFYIAISDNISGNEYSTKWSIDGEELGLSLFDTSSHNLRLAAVTSRSGTGNVWRTEIMLLNRDTGYERTGSFDWNADENWTASAKQFVLNSGDLYTLTNSQVRIDRVSLSTGLEPYSHWAAGYGLYDSESSYASNPDGDSFDNLTEYALGGVPTDADDSGVFPTFGTVEADGLQILEYIYRRRVGADELGLEYRVESTTNLASGLWTNSSVVEVGVSSAGQNFESVTNWIDIGNEPQQFIRLQIEGE